MNMYYFLLVLFCDFVLGNLVNNVRLIDHGNYTINVISETVRRVEEREWCNLKVPDDSSEIDDVVMGWHAKGKISYSNGFVVSIQQVDIQQSTVQGQVNLNTDRQAQAIIRGTLRMHDVAIGYDVLAELEDGTRRYSAIFVYPMVNFAFTTTKIISSEVISVAVVGTVTASRNLPQFMPSDKATDVFTTLFNTTMAVPGIIAWGPDVFQPIAEDVVTTKVPFPTICYNCAA